MVDLQKLRQEHKLTQEKLAESVGVSRTTITMIETGASYPSVKLAQKLAQVLNVRWTDFFTDELPG